MAGFRDVNAGSSKTTTRPITYNPAACAFLTAAFAR